MHHVHRVLAKQIGLKWTWKGDLCPGWRHGIVVSGICRINEVNARQARLVPGWVTVFGQVYHLGM